MPNHVHTAQELADIAAAKECDRLWPRRPDGTKMEAGEWNDLANLKRHAARFDRLASEANERMLKTGKPFNFQPTKKDK